MPNVAKRVSDFLRRRLSRRVPCVHAPNRENPIYGYDGAIIWEGCDVCRKIARGELKRTMTEFFRRMGTDKLTC